MCNVKNPLRLAPHFPPCLFPPSVLSYPYGSLAAGWGRSVHPVSSGFQRRGAGALFVFRRAPGPGTQQEKGMMYHGVGHPHRRRLAGGLLGHLHEAVGGLHQAPLHRFDLRRDGGQLPAAGPGHPHPAPGHGLRRLDRHRGPGGPDRGSAPFPGEPDPRAAPLCGAAAHRHHRPEGHRMEKGRPLPRQGASFFTVSARPAPPGRPGRQRQTGSRALR